MNEIIYFLVGIGCFGVGAGLLLGCSALMPPRVRKPALPGSGAAVVEAPASDTVRSPQHAHGGAA